MKSHIGHDADGRYVTRTLTPAILDSDTKDLATALLEKGRRPTHLVAVARAGSFVADKMAEHLGNEVVTVALTCRRPSTRVKQWLGPIMRLTRYLPVRVVDFLRDKELRYLTGNLDPTRVVEMSGENEQVLVGAATDPGTQIVVVDDCVDTGATLLASIEYVRGLVGSEIAISSAVIALSLQGPMAKPDFHLYENIGLRGPWSYDY